jgi:hypothetical protein
MLIFNLKFNIATPTSATEPLTNTSTSTTTAVTSPSQPSGSKTLLGVRVLQQSWTQTHKEPRDIPVFFYQPTATDQVRVRTFYNEEVTFQMCVTNLLAVLGMEG